MANANAPTTGHEVLGQVLSDQLTRSRTALGLWHGLSEQWLELSMTMLQAHAKAAERLSRCDTPAAAATVQIEAAKEAFATAVDGISKLSSIALKLSTGDAAAHKGAAGQAKTAA